MPHRNGPAIELLADPTRRRIIALLAIRALRPSTAATELGLSRPARTHRLHLLRDAGLISATPSLIDRRAVLYRIASRQHGPMTAWLAGTAVGRPIALAIDDDDLVRHG
jgi:DNA-binding transcriptional ArsR family regulator